MDEVIATELLPNGMTKVELPKPDYSEWNELKRTAACWAQEAVHAAKIARLEQRAKDRDREALLARQATGM